MRSAAPRPFGLSDDEWRDCQLSALEMSLAMGRSVHPHEVALEFALARACDDAEPAAIPYALRPAPEPSPRAISRGPTPFQQSVALGPASKRR